MKAKKIISMVLVLVLALSNFVFASGTNPETITKEAMQQQLKEALKQQLVDSMRKFDGKTEGFKHVDYDGAVSTIPGKADRMELYKNTDKVRVIVELQGDSVAAQAVKNCKTVNNLTVAEKASMEKSLDAIHTQTKAAMEASNLNVEVKYEMKTVINGFTAEVSKSDLALLNKMPNVKKVTVANMYYPEMNNAIDYTNAAAVWNNADLGYKGEGMVVAIIDTGIDWRHSDLKLTDASKAAWDEAEVNALLTEKGISGKYFTPKVPVGWNWADNNNEVIDLGAGASMHGQHVAGIVGANGKVKGVAPEAQLLAEKVFSNNQETGAFSDDIIAAIDHAIKFNADVLNMSLGSSAGFVLSDDPEQAAITRAVNNGVICNISAGNSAYSTIGKDYPLAANPDIAEVGSPGLLPDSVCSAAANNKLYLYEHAVNVAGMTAITGYGKDSWASKTGNLQLVALGGDKLGGPDSYTGIDVTGKVVLVYRGNLTFHDKVVNAMERGAVGVICYDHGNGTFYKDQGGQEIPFMLIKKDSGLALEAALANGPVTFTVNETKKTVDATSGQPTGFSSWGTTPDLGFKPDFMAPGGNIYSLANNDKYQFMSGTSMSSPHMAGGMALIAQALKKQVAEGKLTFASERSFVEYAKIIAMNTSEPVANKYGYEYQPRLQGAGMMKIDRAIKTPVYITGEDGYAGVSLKEIGENKDFTLTLTNTTATAQTYDVNATIGTDYIYDDGFDSLISVYMTENDYDANHVATISPDKTSVTVPANATATVKVSVNIAKAPKNIFVEGYIYFKPQTAGVPQLSVPYFGFYGDWNEPNIIDPAKGTANSYFGYTGILTGIYNPETDEDDLFYTEAISPNKDGILDYTMPIVSFLRNAKDFLVNIKDANGTQIRTITADTNVRKISDLDEGDPAYKFSKSWKWDGQAFNNAKGTYGLVEDGQYYVELKARIDYTNAKWQTVEMPITVDTHGPSYVLTNTSEADADGQYTVNWTSSDVYVDKVTNKSYEGVGIAHTGILIAEVDKDGKMTGNSKIVEVKNPLATSETIELPFKFNLISLGGIDNVMNEGYSDKEQNVVITNQAFATKGAPKVVIDSPENTSVVNSKTVTVSGHVDSPTFYDGVLKVNGQDVIVNHDNTFETAVTYTNDGWNDVQVEAYYKGAYDPAKPETIENRTAYAYKIVVDTTTPDINIGIAGDMTGYTYKGINYVTLNGNVKDASSIGYNVKVNGDAIINTEFDDMMAVDQNFTYAGKLDGTSKIMFAATDLAGNQDSVTVSVYEDNGLNITNGVQAAKIAFNDITATYAGPTIKSVTPTTVVNGDRADVVVDAESLVGIKEVYVNDKQATLKDGKYVLNIPVVDGANPTIVRVVDGLGLSKEQIVIVTADNQGPAIELSMPYLTTSAATYDVTGTILDTTAIKSFKINGTDVTIGEDGSFKQTINVAEGNNNVTLEAVDELGHKTEKTIKVNRVTGSPVVTVKTLQSGLVRYNSPIVLSAKSDRPVDWTVTILDMNGVQVDQLTGHGELFSYSWAPASNDPTGKYTIEYKAADGTSSFTTALGSIDVYNLPIKVAGVKTADVKNVDKNTFKIGDVVMVKSTVKAIDADRKGLVVVQVVGPDNKPFTFKFNPDMAITKTGSTTQLGFSLDGMAVPGQYTVEVYVWNSWDSIEPLSTVGTYSFIVEK